MAIIGRIKYRSIEGFKLESLLCGILVRCLVQRVALE